MNEVHLEIAYWSVIKDLEPRYGYSACSDKSSPTELFGCYWHIEPRLAK